MRCFPFEHQRTSPTLRRPGDHTHPSLNSYHTVHTFHAWLLQEAALARLSTPVVMQSLRDKVDKVGVEDVGVIFVMWSLLQGQVSGPGGLEGINACQGHTLST